MAKKIKLGISKGRAFAADSGVINDSIGRVSYAYKANAKIQLENLTNNQNNSLKTPANQTIVKIDANTNSVDCFYKLLSRESVYKETKKDAVITVTEPTINVYLIRLTGNIYTLEIRNNDPFILTGIDSAPLDIFNSIAISINEVTSIKTKLTDNNFIGSSNAYEFGTPILIQNPSERKYYKSRLSISGSKNGISGIVKAVVDTGIDVYSLDKCNWISAAYANGALTKITGTKWDNQIVPNPIDNNPFSAYWHNGSNTGLKDRLNTIISQADNLPSTNDNKGYRLLNTAIRDYIYQGNIEKVTFEMAFRLPFYIENIKEVPYTTVNGRFNNPYYTKFDEWFGYANGLRTLAGYPTAKLLSRTGHMQSFKDSIQANPDHLKLYSLFTKFTRNATLTKYKIPAYIAALMDDENSHEKFDAYFTIPAKYKLRTNTAKRLAARTEKTSNDLLKLKNNGFITLDSYNNLIQAGYNVFVAEPIIKSKANLKNGYYVFKSAIDNKFYIYDKLNSNYWSGNSGLTVAFGYDMGGKSVGDFEPVTNDQKLLYITGFTGISDFQKNIIKMGFGLHKDKAVALFYTYFENVFNVVHISYDYAVSHAQPLMKKSYFKLGLGTKGGLRKINNDFLKIYEASPEGIEFYDPNGKQYLNEIEKFIFGTQLYNVGAGGFNAGSKNFLRPSRYFVHSVNTHDIRWMKEFLRENKPKNTTMWRRKDLRDLLDKKNVYDHYNINQITL